VRYTKKEMCVLDTNLKRELFMKIHVKNYENDLNTAEDKLAVYFRNSYIKEKFEKEDILEMYQSLTDTDKYVLIGLLKDLLPNKNKDAFIGVFLKEFMNEGGFTSYSLAKLLYEYMQVSVSLKERYEEYKDLETIKSKIQKLMKCAKTKEDDIVIRLIADYFNVSFDVLLRGEGVRYSIDLERLYEIVDLNGMDADTFLKEHYEMDFDIEYIDNGTQKGNDTERYKQYIYHSAKAFAEIVEQQLGIDSSEIIIEEDIWIEWSADIFTEIFEKLSAQNQEIVFNTLRRMYLNRICF